MLPYGKKDRPIYAKAWQAGELAAKEKCDLVPFDFPGVGRWCESCGSAG
jgi:hypothetical protein